MYKGWYAIKPNKANQTENGKKKHLCRRFWKLPNEFDLYKDIK